MLQLFEQNGVEFHLFAYKLKYNLVYVLSNVFFDIFGNNISHFDTFYNISIYSFYYYNIHIYAPHLSSCILQL